MKLTEQEKEFLKICGMKRSWGAGRIAQACRDYGFIDTFKRLENAEQFLKKYNLNPESYFYFVYNLLRLARICNERA